jgi:DNA polymerase-3 subunit delta
MARSALHSICVIYGKSEYLRRQALDEVIERELDGSDPSLNLLRLEGSQAEAAAVLDDVRTYSLLGGRRVVVVEDADGFMSKHRAVLERFVAAPPDAGCLVLVCNTLDARTRLCKAIKKTGFVVECKPVQGQALVTWMMKRANEQYGKRLGREAAVRVREHAGSSQQSLDQELAKLSLFVGARGEIKPDDVDALVGHYREQNVFAVMDAIAEGDAKTALEEWRQVIATDPAAVGRSIGGMAWSARKLLDARRRLDAGESVHALARFNWTDPATFARRMELATVEDREDQLLALLKADVDSKTGASDFISAVEKFIVDMAGRARAKAS